MGIALCHIAQESDEFHFSKESGVPERKRYIYTSSVRGAIRQKSNREVLDGFFRIFI